MKKRVALVIGNSNYNNSPLANPVNDANDMTEVLEQLGFEVEKEINVKHVEMENAFIRFIKKLRDSEASLVYFAGHGLQIKGENYLAPIDIETNDETAVLGSSYNVNDYLRKISHYRDKTNIIILDACRTNPFIRGLRGSVASGFASFTEAPVGTFISYSTSPERGAADGMHGDTNGLYTGILKRSLKIPNIRIEDTFKLVRSELDKVSNGEQISWEHSSLVGDFYFSVVEHTELELVQKEVYEYMSSRYEHYDNENYSTYDKECLPILDAYSKYNRPIIEIMRLYSRESYSRIDQKFTDAELDYINMSYLSAWGFKYDEHRWYYGDKYVKMGDPLPLPERFLEKEPVEDNELNVELNPTGFLDSGKVYFEIVTNLPSETAVMFTLSTRDNKYRAQCKASVINGLIRTDGFSLKGSVLKDGMYLLSMSSPMNDLQPEDVRKILGERGRNLIGEYVKHGSMGGKSIRGSWTVIKSNDQICTY